MNNLMVSIWGKGYWVHASAYTPYLSPYQLHVPYINLLAGENHRFINILFPIMLPL